MRKSLWLAAMLLAGASYGQINTNVIPITVGDADGHNYGQFDLDWAGWDDQYVAFGLDRSYPTNFSWTFKMARDSLTGQVVYVSVSDSDITAATTSVTFSVAHTNIPPNAEYKAALRVVNPGGQGIDVARGIINVTDSLYDDSDWTNIVTGTSINFSDYSESGVISGVTVSNGTFYGDGSGLTNLTGTIADGDKTDITVSGSGATWTIDAGAVTPAKLDRGYLPTATGGIVSNDVRLIAGSDFTVGPVLTDPPTHAALLFVATGGQASAFATDINNDLFGTQWGGAANDPYANLVLAGEDSGIWLIGKHEGSHANSLTLVTLNATNGWDYGFAIGMDTTNATSVGDFYILGGTNQDDLLTSSIFAPFRIDRQTEKVVIGGTTERLGADLWGTNRIDALRVANSGFNSAWQYIPPSPYGSSGNTAAVIEGLDAAALIISQDNGGQGSRLVLGEVNTSGTYIDGWYWQKYTASGGASSRAAIGYSDSPTNVPLSTATNHNIRLDADGSVYFPNANGITVAGTVAANAVSGDGSALTAVDAATGDSATGFFDAGTLELARGGTGQSLTDPNADGIFLWDDSDTGSEINFAAIGSGLSFDGTTLSATASGAWTNLTAGTGIGYEAAATNDEVALLLETEEGTVFTVDGDGDMRLPTQSGSFIVLNTSAANNKLNYRSWDIDYAARADIRNINAAGYIALGAGGTGATDRKLLVDDIRVSVTNADFVVDGTTDPYAFVVDEGMDFVAFGTNTQAASERFRVAVDAYFDGTLTLGPSATFVASQATMSVSNVQAQVGAYTTLTGTNTYANLFADISNTGAYWQADADSLDINVPSGDVIDLKVNDTSVVQANSTGATISGDVTVQGDIVWNPNEYVLSTNRTWTATELSHAIVYVTGASTQTLPAVNGQVHCTFIADGAVVVTVDPNASDLIRLDGTAAADGEAILSGGTAGEIAVISYRDANGWYAATDGWTEETP